MAAIEKKDFSHTHKASFALLNGQKKGFNY